MTDCPNCGETFVSLANGELCPDCRPPESLIVGPSLPDADSVCVGERRGKAVTAPPLGVAILSIWTHAGAAVGLVLGIAALAGPNALAAVLRALGGSERDSALYSLETRLILAGVFLLLSLFVYVVGRGLWRLRNWARVTILLISGLDLILGSPPSKIISRIVSLVVVCYLLTPNVKAFFRLTRTQSPQAV